MKTTLYMIIFNLFLTTTVFAVPYLQLDISDSVYVGTPEETITSTSDKFTLYALVDTTSSDYVAGEEYYISMAVTPKLSAGSNLGSFKFDGITYQVTNDMEYGTPPIEVTANNLDLAGHGIFETYYTEFKFLLGNPPPKAAEYNSQDNPGGLVADVNGSLAYAAFDVDVTNLDSNYEIHFDLYTLSYNDQNSSDQIDKFAPFSHDAETGGDGDTPGNPPVPEPATLLLMGMGLLGMAGLSRKKSFDFKYK